MIDTDLASLGTLGLLAVLVGREVVRMSNEREIHQNIRELHQWHAKTDQDGVPVWYVRQSLEEAIVRLADNIEKQTELLRFLHEDHRDLHAEVRRSETMRREAAR